MGTILNGFRCALAIISGIVILICSSAKPAGLAELLFHGRDAEGNRSCRAGFLPKQSHGGSVFC